MEMELGAGAGGTETEGESLLKRRGVRKEGMKERGTAGGGRGLEGEADRKGDAEREGGEGETLFK